jgi:hypothetical protein
VELGHWPFATQLWEACEPSTIALFDKIDRYVLRLTTESAYTGIHSRAPAANPAHFATFVATIVDRQGFEPSVATEWKNFLTRLSVPDDPAIFAYSSQFPIEGSGASYASILSRATLLLRLATGSGLKLIRSAGITGQQIEFWWRQLGISRGVWTGNRSQADLLDLWDDIEALLSDVRQYQQMTAAGDQSFHSINADLPQVVAGLGGCERVAIWSLATT